MNSTTTPSSRVTSALKTQFVADALAMPVHWYYRPVDIQRAFPGGIQRFEAAPEYHPSSIMSLHSTSGGGRRARGPDSRQEVPSIVGEVILKGRAKYWDRPNVHYHQGMGPGENTLNAHCARVLMRTLAATAGRYDRHAFLEAYIGFMTAEPPAHPDTYAESYHRGFFANLERGMPPEQCGMKTHDTPSIGGLATIATLVFSQRLLGSDRQAIQTVCRQHLALTHPDDTLMETCDQYVALLCGLIDDPGEASMERLLVEAGNAVGGFDVAALAGRNLPDHQVVGRLYSTACYISDSWPAVLYLAYKYRSTPWTALRVNTDLGGDNVHRGMVLGSVLGLVNGDVAAHWFDQLAARSEIQQEIDNLVTEANAPRR